MEIFDGNITILDVLARLLVGGPSGLLTSSFAPFGRSGRVNQPGGGTPGTPGGYPECDRAVVEGLGQAYYEVGMYL